MDKFEGDEGSFLELEIEDEDVVEQGPSQPEGIDTQEKVSKPADNEEKPSTADPLDSFQDFTVAEVETVEVAPKETASKSPQENDKPIEPDIMDMAPLPEELEQAQAAPSEITEENQTSDAQGTDLVQYEPQEGDGTAHAKSSSEVVNKAEGGIGDESVRKSGRMGDRLVEQGYISTDQLNVALQEKKISGKMLGEILVDLGFVTEDDLTAFLAESSGFGVFDPQNMIFDGEVLSMLDKATAMKHSVLPVTVTETEIQVAMEDPYDVLAMDTLRRIFPKELTIKPLVTNARVLSDAIDAAYGYASSTKDILKELEENKEQVDVASLDESEAFAHPIVRLVNALVFDAVKMGVSDLHFEPEENFIRLRYRKDGVLFTYQILHKQHWAGISQRLKILSKMDIADKLMPQDGRFHLNVGGREADFRVSSLPTVHGENIVLRVLDKSASIMPLGKLGFSDENMAKIAKAQTRPEGIIIVTGPTGSGKTTSLYSMLNEINDIEVNIQTLEDPVEYSLPMIRQTNVRSGYLDFADGIKALLRQDPDIIFIGEVRDKTTAEMALKAAMTGHQVYTSLHTNDSFGAIPRLLDLGLKPGMLAGAIVAVFAQRLARRLCQGCKQPYTPDAQECEILGIDPSNPPTLYGANPGGCENCGGKGYKGRVAVVEILLFDEELDEVLAKNKSKAELKEVAVKNGFKSMRDDGILKILDGMTDIAAVSKVVNLRG